MAFEAHDPSPSQIDLPVFSACLADIYLEDWEEIPPCTEMRETIEWIEAPSHFPLRVFSIAASLVMFGTAIARQYSTPYKKGGTSLYVACLAPSGAGKNDTQIAIDRLMRESNLSRCLAPPCFTSGGVLERFLAKNPASLSVSDEFGNELQGITRRNATSAEAGKLKTLKELFTIQFSTYVTTQMALTDSEQIEAPSYSIFASSTPGDFYKSLEGSPATGGFLNRFLVLPVRRKIPRMTASELIRRDDARSRTRGRAVEEISSHLRRVNLRRDTANRIYPNQPPPSVKAQGKEFSIDPEIVGWANKATKQLWYEYKLHCSQEISESGEDAQLYFSRAAEIALRIATIISVSRLSNRPYEHALIDSEVMTWSIRFVDWAMRQNFFIAQEYMHTSEYASKRDRILQLIANLSKQAADGWVSHSVVVNRLQKQFPGARVLNDQINVLLEARMLTVEKRESSTGRKPKFYRIADR